MADLTKKDKDSDNINIDEKEKIQEIMGYLNVEIYKLDKFKKAHKQMQKNNKVSKRMKKFLVRRGTFVVILSFLITFNKNYKGVSYYSDHVDYTLETDLDTEEVYIDKGISSDLENLKDKTLIKEYGTWEQTLDGKYMQEYTLYMEDDKEIGDSKYDVDSIEYKKEMEMEEKTGLSLSTISVNTRIEEELTEKDLFEQDRTVLLEEKKDYTKSELIYEEPNYKTELWLLINTLLPAIELTISYYMLRDLNKYNYSNFINELSKHIKYNRKIKNNKKLLEDYIERTNAYLYQLSYIIDNNMYNFSEEEKEKVKKLMLTTEDKIDAINKIK